jgi:hypothetical protein
MELMELWNYVKYVLMCNKCGGRTSRRRVFFWNPIWPPARSKSGRNERLDAGKHTFERLPNWRRFLIAGGGRDG